MALRKTARQLVDEANAKIESVSAERAIELAARGEVVLVDLRDIRERQRVGFVPGSIHAPRGMLEFWVDPESPYHRDLFATGEHFLFYCQSGWRSALATLAVQEMGLTPVSHIESGFQGWVDAGGDVVKTDDGREPG